MALLMDFVAPHDPRLKGAGLVFHGLRKFGGCHAARGRLHDGGGAADYWAIDANGRVLRCGVRDVGHTSAA